MSYLESDRPFQLDIGDFPPHGQLNAKIWLTNPKGTEPLELTLRSGGKATGLEEEGQTGSAQVNGRNISIELKTHKQGKKGQGDLAIATIRVGGMEYAGEVHFTTNTVQTIFDRGRHLADVIHGERETGYTPL